MQKLINRIFIILILFSYTLFGCTLCTVYSPQTKYYVNLKVEDKRIKEADITWVLTKEFTDSLKDVYDKNANNILDSNEEEMGQVAQSLYDYAIPNNYLTTISYGKTINKDVSLPIKVKDKRVYIKNSILHFNYKVKLDLSVKKDNALYIKINDEQKYFILSLQEKLSKINVKDVSIVEGSNEIIFNFSKSDISLEEKESIEEKEEKKEEPKEEIVKIEEEKSKSILEDFVLKVKEYLVKIEKGDDYALFILLGVSFLYGIIHALGPGHGKSLAFSYFASNKSSFIKAFWVSQASAFIHIIGALILVVISVFVLESVLNNFVNDSVEILTKVSAVMIIALAIYILYNKLNHNSCSCSSCCTSHETVSTTPTWSTIKPTTAASLKPNFMKKDLYFVLTAGLIPCPGTVVLFIYAFILKTYFAVILASIAISLGMGLVIFASSFLGVSVHKLSEKSHKLTNTLEILAPIVMMILGVLLYLNADIF